MVLPPIEYLVGDWCAVGAPILVSGPTKCGKTFFMYSLAHAVSVGAPIFGWETPSGGAPVAIVDGEMRPQSIKRRRESITKHIPGTGEMQIVTREFFTDRGEKFPDLSNPKDLNILLNRLSPKDKPVKVIVLSSCFPDMAVNNRTMTLIIRKIQNLTGSMKSFVRPTLISRQAKRVLLQRMH